VDAIIIWVARKLSAAGLNGTIDAIIWKIMKHAVIGIFLSLMLSSSALAILRPRCPVKPTPPFRGHVIVIEDDDAIQTGPPKLRR